MASETQNDIDVKIYVEKIANLEHNAANPRTIRQKGHGDLKQSLTEFPQMKQIREIVVDENLLILAGDKRVYALEEMGYTEVLVKMVSGLTDRQKREFIIKDNNHNGEYDTDILANEWDMDELKEWGVPDFKLPGDDGGKKDKQSIADKTLCCGACGYEGPASEFKVVTD
jgi:hypothetical protein